MSKVPPGSQDSNDGATRPLVRGAVAPAVPVPVPTIPMRPISVGEAHGVTRLDWTRGRALSGRYVMVELLGEGGMGTVYLADDLLLRRRIALKTLWSDQTFDPHDIERFRKEVALAHAVNHANVARTYDLGEAGGVQFITMEHLKGETLMARIKRGPPLTAKEVRALALPLCRGLGAAHRAGVVHRDLKPANIMMVEDDRIAVIMDFGIARAEGELPGDDQKSQHRDGGSVWDVTSAGLGTPAYMAPEQWDEQSGDQRTDIYALGVILYVCLTGQAPYAAGTAAELAERHRSAPVPDVSAIAHGVDKPLARLITDCLAKDPGHRPQSMDDVLERLERPTLRRRYALQFAGTALASAVVAFLLGAAIFSVAETALLREMKPALARLALLLARDIDVRDLDAVRKPADVNTAAFRRVHATLVKWRQQSPEIHELYTMKRTPDPSMFMNVVDLRPRDVDEDGNGKIEGIEAGAPPGDLYNGEATPSMSAVFKTGQVQTDKDFIEDRFAVSLSAYAPILRNGETSEYFVGVDTPNVQLSELKLRLLVVMAGVWLAVTATMAFLLDPRRRRLQAARALQRVQASHPGTVGT